jgi:hypothetical protein
VDETDFTSIVTQAKASGAPAIGLCDVTRRLTSQLPLFQDSGLFDDPRVVVAFLPAITDIHAAGGNAAKGLLLATSFYWNQNDQARSFANRSVAADDLMPDAPHAAAYAAIRHYLRAVVVTEGLDVLRINQENAPDSNLFLWPVRSPAHRRPPRRRPFGDPRQTTGGNARRLGSLRTYQHHSSGGNLSSVRPDRLPAGPLILIVLDKRQRFVLDS